MGRKQTKRLVASISVALLIIACTHLNSTVATETSRQDASSNQLNRGAPTRAKVLLESKSFDLDQQDEGSQTRRLLQEEPSQLEAVNSNESNQIEATNKTSHSLIGREKRKRKEGRRLSDIWSMFMPNAQDEGEQEEEEDNADEAAPVGVDLTTSANEKEAALNRTSPANLPAADQSHSNSSSKLRPGFTKPNKSVQSATRPLSGSLEAEQTSRLIMGSLSVNSTEAPHSDQAVSRANANEISSNLMSSLKTSTPNRGSDEDQVDIAPANGTTSSENSSFERWFNKIKSANPHLGLTDISATSSGLEREQNVAGPNSSLGQSRSQAVKVGSKPASHREFANSTTRRANKIPLELDGSLVHGKRENGGVSKTNPRRATQVAHQFHPFQQHLRQRQSQLIHGIKLPQASTISVSTQDGSSNTSLAFGSHYVPQINPSNTVGNQHEMSQEVNSTQTPSNHKANAQLVSGGHLQQAPPSSDSGTNPETGGGSQDEILRQVTSAINFEQQRQQLMSQQRRSNGLQKLPTETSQQTEQAEEEEDSMFMTPEGASKLLKSSSFSAQSNETSASQMQTLDNLMKSLEVSSSSTQQNRTETTSNSGELDRNFELLAERVRQLVSQQQNFEQQELRSNLMEANRSQPESQQPSWLRVQQKLASLQGSGANQVDALIKQSGNFSGSSSQFPLELNQVRDLLQKHETTRDELRRTKETMMVLMQQMMQLKSSQPNETSPEERQSVRANTTPGNNPKQMMANPNSGGENPHPNELSNLGWAPVSSLIDSMGNPKRRPVDATLPSSPANFMKGRLRFPEQVAQQHNFRLRPTPNSDPLQSHDAQQIDLDQTNEVDQRIIGLPIALVNNQELELSHQQLEEAARLAAEQLGAMPTNPKKFMPHTGENQRANQRDSQLSQVQRLLKSSSPQTFAQLMSMQQDPNGANGQQQQNQQNFMQLEKLVSLLPPLEQNIERGPEEAELISGSPRGRPAESANEGLKKQASQKLRVGSVNDNPRLNQQNRVANQSNHHQQQQQQQQQQQRRLNRPQSPAPQQQMATLPVGQYGQVPHPASKSLVQGFRPLLDSNHFLPAGLQQQQMVPARQLYDEPSPPELGYTTISSGPPMRLHELTFRRPFGFRGHHSISYQASPVVADMFPRLVARPPSAPLTTAASRPGVLRHMTPIRATINEGHRLISQMLPPRLNHYYQQQHYPTHDSIGRALPIPPAQHHHLMEPNQIRRATGIEEDRRQRYQRKLSDWSPSTILNDRLITGSELEPMDKFGLKSSGDEDNLEQIHMTQMMAGDNFRPSLPISRLKHREHKLIGHFTNQAASRERDQSLKMPQQVMSIDMPMSSAINRRPPCVSSTLPTVSSRSSNGSDAEQSPTTQKSPPSTSARLSPASISDQSSTTETSTTNTTSISLTTTQPTGNTTTITI